MKTFALILLCVSLAYSQPSIYNRLPENIESNSPATIANTTFTTEGLGAGTGWAGTYDLFLRVKCDTLYENPSQAVYGDSTPTYYYTIAGIALGFSYPAGSTLTITYEYWLAYSGYQWLYVTGYSFCERGDSNHSKQGSLVSQTLTIAESDRIVMGPYYLHNGGKNVARHIGDAQENSTIYKENLDTSAVIRIRFRLDVGGTQGQENVGSLRLKWNTLYYNPSATPTYPARGDDFGYWVIIPGDPDADPPGETTYEWRNDIKGTPNFSTTMLRGSTFIAHRIY